MRYYRLTAIAIILLTVVLQTSAQALNDRYNSNRPILITCDSRQQPFAFVDQNGNPAGLYVDIVKAVLNRLDLPYSFVEEEDTETWTNFKTDDADLTITDSRDSSTTGYSFSKNTIHYKRTQDGSIIEVHFASRDRQLIEQMDDQFTRLKQEGVIAALQENWINPQQNRRFGTSTMLYIAVGILLFALSICLLLRLLIKSVAHRCTNLSKMISQAQQTNKYYATEDSPSTHDLLRRYEAILCTPFLAISFYDNNGQLIVENEAMKKLGLNDTTNYRKPIYNLKGEVANYIVTISNNKEST